MISQIAAPTGRQNSARRSSDHRERNPGINRTVYDTSPNGATEKKSHNIKLDKTIVQNYITPKSTVIRRNSIMPQSLSSIYIHLVFSTKNRIPLITPEMRPRLWAYLGGICNALRCLPVQVGGTDDHVHILCVLSRDVTVKDLVAKIKADSSRWIKNQSPPIPDFYWQTGYGAFSVNPQESHAAVQYIADQSEHHKKRSFQEEFLLFLKKYNIEYDEKHLWDEP